MVYKFLYLSHCLVPSFFAYLFSCILLFIYIFFLSINIFIAHNTSFYIFYLKKIIIIYIYIFFKV